jgi:hypothetical protein
MTVIDIWTYRDSSALGADPTAGIDLSGYKVEAIDGGIGKVDEATYEIGSSYVVVDTGPWIFGKKVLLPAGVIERIEPAEEKVFVNRTKDQIKDSPEFDETTYTDPAYRSEVGSYYGPEGRGFNA